MTYLVGAARAVITPAKVTSMAGYSLGSKRATDRAKWEDLHATALYAQDEAGEELILCCVDLHAGMRPLWWLAAQQVERAVGVPKGRIVLTGTHTHTGPGQMYGSMYDLLAQDDWFLDGDLVRATAERIARAMIDAKERAEPGTLTIATTTIWGFGSNQSLAAHDNHPDGRRWYTPGYPGANPPAGLSALERAVDPRLTVLFACNDAGLVLGALGYFGTHATALGPEMPYFSPDWCGVAYDTARAALEAAGVAAPGAVIGIGASTMGDVGPLPLTGTSSGRPAKQGPDLQRSIGTRVGTELANLVQSRRPVGDHPPIRVAHGIWVLDPAQDPRLAEWCFGWPTVGGSEDGRSFLQHLVHEGDQDESFAADHPQFPKNRLPEWLNLVRLRAPTRFPLHVVRIGTMAFATVPGEPTVLAGWQITRALVTALADAGIEDARVLGYSNEYAGYFTTTPEFEMQHYEGSSTIFGKYQVDRLTEELVALARAGTIDDQPEPPFEEHRHLRGWLGCCSIPRGLRR